MSRPLILAHRGDWSHADENSLAAFEAALLRPGVDGVEFDVRAAGDGTPVVIHDATLRRVRRVGRRVRELSAPELRALGVPALADVLAILPAPFFLDIELKDADAARAIAVIAETRGDPPREVVVSSFDLGLIAATRAAAPRSRCWLIARRLDAAVIQSALTAGCAGIAARWPTLTRPARQLAADAGLELAAWTADDQPTLQRLSSMRLTAICVDPAALP